MAGDRQRGRGGAAGPEARRRVPGLRQQRLKEGWPLGHGVPGSSPWKRGSALTPAFTV